MKRLSRVMEDLDQRHLAWVLTDPFGNIERVGAAFVHLCGYTLREVQGRKPKEFLHGPFTEPDRREILSSYLWNRLPVSTQITNFRKNGASYRAHLSIMPYTLQGNTMPHFFGISQDLRGREKPNREERAVIYQITKRLYGDAGRSHGSVAYLGG